MLFGHVPRRVTPQQDRRATAAPQSRIRPRAWPRHRSASGCVVASVDREHVRALPPPSIRVAATATAATSTAAANSSRLRIQHHHQGAGSARHLTAQTFVRSAVRRVRCRCCGVRGQASAVGSNAVSVHASVRGRGAQASTRHVALGGLPSAPPALDVGNTAHPRARGDPVVRPLGKLPVPGHRGFDRLLCGPGSGSSLIPPRHRQRAAQRRGLGHGAR